MGELGISDVEELFSLSWVEWEYRIEHYRLQSARNHWEPTRELYTLITNMFSDKKYSARELIPLYSDDAAPTRQAQELAENKALWSRLIGPPTPTTLAPSPQDEKIMTD